MGLPRLIRLLLVTADRDVALWLQRVLEQAEPGSMELVRAIAPGDEARARAAGIRPDVIVLDIEAGDIAAIARLGAECPAPILVLAAECDGAARVRVMRAGARGVVLKRDAPGTIRKAVRKVKEGELWLDRVTTGLLLKELLAGAAQPGELPAIGRIANLTERESDIVRALLGEQGANSRELAARLRIGEQTLRNHFCSIYRKLGIPNRVGLVAYATRHRLDSTG
jgi:DNA-binding NarL/FixJ family response regulator